MNYLFNSLHYSINFYGIVRKRYYDVIKHMKAKAFEHKLIYYASYDLKTEQYVVTQNYDTIWYILYFYITNYLLKLNYAGLSYTDLDLFINVQDMVIITSYILAGREYHAILDERKEFEKKAPYNIVYAFTDSSCDLTHEFNTFVQSPVLFSLTPQHIYNIVTHYSNKYEKKKVKTINYMHDRNFEEIVLST